MCNSNHTNDQIQTSELGKLSNSNLNRGATGSINRLETYKGVGEHLETHFYLLVRESKTDYDYILLEATWLLHP